MASARSSPPSEAMRTIARVREYLARIKEREKRRNQIAGINIRKDEYGSLMETFLPDDEDWIEFGKKSLMVDAGDLRRAQNQFTGEQLKTEILKMWILKYGSEATVSKAYELAHKFRNDELEEVFRFLAKLIPDAREWKKFAKYGLKLESNVYKEYENEISSEQKLRMLRQWREREGDNSIVDKLCVAVRTHFEGKPVLANAFKALCEGQKTMHKLCEAVKKGMSMKSSVGLNFEGDHTTVHLTNCSVKVHAGNGVVDDQ